MLGIEPIFFWRHDSAHTMDNLSQGHHRPPRSDVVRPTEQGGGDALYWMEGTGCAQAGLDLFKICE